MGTNRIDIGRLTGARGHSPSVAPTKSSVFEEIQPTLIQYLRRPLKVACDLWAIPYRLRKLSKIVMYQRNFNLMQLP